MWEDLDQFIYRHHPLKKTHLSSCHYEQFFPTHIWHQSPSPLILKPPVSWQTCPSLDCVTPLGCSWGGWHGSVSPGPQCSEDLRQRGIEAGIWGWGRGEQLPTPSVARWKPDLMPVAQPTGQLGPGMLLESSLFRKGGPQSQQETPGDITKHLSQLRNSPSSWDLSPPTPIPHPRPVLQGEFTSKVMNTSESPRGQGFPLEMVMLGEPQL